MPTHRRRIIPLVIIPVLLALSSCTNHQIGKWLDWYGQDPEAAVAFAQQPEIQAQLTQTQRTIEQNAQQPAAAPEPQSEPAIDWSVNWDAVARCESGGNWGYPPVTNRSGTYTGGLMIWTKAWDAYGGGEFASDAYLASKGQQIIVAERILADNGRGAWDCL